MEGGRGVGLVQLAVAADRRGRGQSLHLDATGSEPVERGGLRVHLLVGAGADQ